MRFSAGKPSGPYDCLIGFCGFCCVRPPTNMCSYWYRMVRSCFFVVLVGACCVCSWFRLVCDMFCCGLGWSPAWFLLVLGIAANGCLPFLPFILMVLHGFQSPRPWFSSLFVAAGDAFWFLVVPGITPHGSSLLCDRRPIFLHGFAAVNYGVSWFCDFSASISGNSARGTSVPPIGHS